MHQERSSHRFVKQLPYIVTCEVRLFLVTCMLSLVTWLGGSSDFRIDRQKTIEIPVNFPGENLVWKKIGERENIQIDRGGITILSHNPGKARVYRDIFIGEPNHSLLQPDLILTEARIRPLNILVDSSMIGIDSRFHIQQRNFSDERKFRLFAHTPLSFKEDGSTRPISVQSVTRQIEGSDTLRVSLVLHSAGAWKLEQLDLYKGRLAKSYLIFLIVVSALWLCLLLRVISIYAKKSVLRSSILIFLSGTVLVLAFVPIRHSSSVSSVIGWFVGEALPANWSVLMESVLINYQHFLAHFILTVILLCISGTSSHLIQRVVLLNIGLAVSIESWQSHSFIRTSQALDIGEATVGMAVAVLLYIVCNSAYSRLKEMTG